MTMSVYWEDPPGTRLPSLQFTPGQNMHLSVQVRSLFGLPEPNAPVSVDIRSTGGEMFDPIYLSGETNQAGNIAWDFLIPNVVATAQATIVVNQGTPVINNIGIGSAPEPPPTGQWDIGQIVLVAGVAVGALLLVNALKK